jgi:hypothetical protein
VKLVLKVAFAGGGVLKLIVWLAFWTVRVKSCVAFGDTPLFAVMVIL